MTPRILLLVRAPRRGTVKTRLARDLGADAALHVYRGLVEQQLASIPRGWAVDVWYTPADAESEMRAWLGDACSFHSQVEGDLGARLKAAFSAALATTAQAIAIGADCPELDAATLVRAAAELAATDVVLGPAVDGGYYLIGLRQPAPELFEGIAWGTERVLSATLARAKGRGLGCALLEPKEDVDDLASWSRAQPRIAARGTRLSVVIPALNEAAGIARCVTRVRTLLPFATVHVVDGGSSDATVERAAAAGAAVLRSPRGRGRQCRIGADASGGEWLLFLHADTLLSDEAPAAISAFIAEPAARIATFRLRFDDGNWFLRVSGWCTRFDSVFTRFGDQGILIRRDFYQAIGGFPDWPLFEDVALLQHARQQAQVRSLPAYVTTSARRFRARGRWRQQWLNARLLLLYLGGVSPHALARRYAASAKPMRTSDAGAADCADEPATCAPSPP